MTGAPKVESIALASIKDAGAQMREEMHPQTIADYCEAMLDGAVFPPIVLYHDGTDYFLGDGYHRLEAARKIERKEIAAEIRQGGARDAILCGAGANAFHGLRRTQADRRRAIERLLRDPEWAKWSDRKIGDVCQVDHKTVGKVRRELTGGESPQAEKATATGEIPHPKSDAALGVPNASLVSRLLRSLPDAAIVAECRRRGLTVAS